MSQLETLKTLHFYTSGRSEAGFMSQFLSQLMSQLMSQLSQAVFPVRICCAGRGVFDQCELSEAFKITLQSSAVDGGKS